MTALNKTEKPVFTDKSGMTLEEMQAFWNSPEGQAEQEQMEAYYESPEGEAELEASTTEMEEYHTALVETLLAENPGYVLLEGPVWYSTLDQMEYELKFNDQYEKALKGARPGTKFRLRVRFADGDDELHIDFKAGMFRVVDDAGKYTGRDAAMSDPTDVMLFHDGTKSRLEVHSGIYEMSYSYVKKGKPEVVKRVAEFVAKIMADGEVSMYGMMASNGRCQACNRSLKDPISKVLQFGPICARKRGMPHNTELAKAVIKWKKENQS